MFAEVLTVAWAVSENVLLKVIVESAVLLRDAGPDTLQRVCEQAVAAGAGMVKTSTGFHPAGGASVRRSRLMADAVGGSAGVRPAAESAMRGSLQNSSKPVRRDSDCRGQRPCSTASGLPRPDGASLSA